MISFLKIILIVISISFIIFFEIRSFKKVFTPTTVLAFPISIALIINLILSEKFGLRVVSIKTVAFIMFNSILFFLGGQIISIVLTRGRLGNLKKNQITNNKLLYKTCVIISSLSILLSYFEVIKFLLIYGLQGVSSEEFSAIYSTGIVAHLRNLSFFTFFYFSFDAINRKNRISLIFSMLIFGSFLFYPVKYPLIWFVIGTLYLLYLEDKITLNLKKAITTLILLFLVFSSVYIIDLGNKIGFNNVLNVQFLEFLVRHFHFYLTSSILGLDVLLESTNMMSYDLRYFIMVPYNFFAKVFNFEYVNIIHDWVNISSDKMTNVYTMFGSLYMNSGFIGTYVSVVLISSLSYFLYLFSWNRKNIYIKILNVINMAIITTAFFGFYYNMILVWEVFAILIFMSVISKIRFKYS